jgi:N-acetylmuramoyl-L-alanine amidase
MRHGYTSQNEGPDRRRHLPEFSQPQSAEPDTSPRLSAFAGWEAQNAEREAAEELRKDADILAAVLAAQKQIATARLDLEQSLAFIAEGAHRLTRADGAAIALSDGEKTVCRARSGDLAPELGAYLNPQSGICAYCLTSGEVQLCNDTEYDQRVNLSPNLGVRSVLAVPLRRQRDVLGIIAVFSAAPDVFCKRDVRALKLLAGLVIDALWSNEAHPQPAAAPEPGESLQAQQPLAGPIPREPADSRDGIACAVRLEPAAPASKVEEIRAQVEAAAAPEPAPGSTKSRRLRWSLAIIAGVIVALAATTEVRLWRGEHVRELLRHLKRAVSAASLTTTVLATTTAPVAPAEYSATLSPTEPYRLTIVVGSARADSPMPSGNEGRALALRPALDHPKIVLDPGHGGNEIGAIGHGGLKEKDLTLQICSKLRNLLASRLGAQVIFTRSTDLNVPLEERASIANQAGANLLISVHVNSSDDAGTRGVETYYAANGRPAAAEGGAPMPAADEGNLSESRRLAVQVQRALYETVGGDKNVPDRGVKQAPFVVLLDAKIPSVLAEVGFLTNPAEEHNLATTAGQEAVANALYRGIADYLAAAGQGKALTGNGQ